MLWLDIISLYHCAAMVVVEREQHRSRRHKKVMLTMARRQNAFGKKGGWMEIRCPFQTVLYPHKNVSILLWCVFVALSICISLSKYLESFFSNFFLYEEFMVFAICKVCFVVTLMHPPAAWVTALFCVLLASLLTRASIGWVIQSQCSWATSSKRKIAHYPI